MPLVFNIAILERRKNDGRTRNWMDREVKMRDRIIRLAQRPLIWDQRRWCRNVIVHFDHEGWSCIFAGDCYCAVDNSSKRIIQSGSIEGKYTPAKRAKICAAVERWRKQTAK